MNKKELASKAAGILRDRDVRKTVPPSKTKLYVRDENGDKKTFSVSIKQKSVSFNEQDISVVIDALADAIVDGIRNGEELFLMGMGTIAPYYRAPRHVRNPFGEGLIDIPPHLVVKYTPGKRVKTAMRDFELTQTHEEMKKYAGKYTVFTDEDDEGDGGDDDGD